MQYFFLFFPIFLFGQVNKISGVVIHDYLPQTNTFVYLVSENNSSILKYSTTNSKGFFEFDTPNNSNLVIQVKSHRFETANVKVVNDKTFYEIQLIEKQNYKTKSLEEVIIKKEFLVRKTGDSIKYKAKNFVTRSDRTLEDLIKNIPGLEVDPDGVISYQGKKIVNFYIEGDDFLSKIYRTATQNLNVEMIDEIQILENNQHIKMLQGKIESINTGLNIVLKDDFKGKWIYNLEVGAGYKNLYKINPLATFFKKKFKSINLAKANNAGEDLSKMFGSTDFNDLLTDLEINFSDNQLAITNTSLPNLTKKRFNNIAAAFNSNLSYVFSKSLDLQSNFVYYKDFNINESINQTQFNNSQLSIGFTENNKFNSKGNFYSQLFKFRKNSNENYFTNDLKFQYYSENSNSLLSNVNQNLRNNYFEVKNNFKIIKTYKQIFFDFKSIVNFSYLNDGLNITPGIFDNKLNFGSDYSLTKQKVENKILFFKNNLQSTFTYNYFKFGLALENVLSNRDNNSDLTLVQNDGIFNLLDEYRNQNNFIYTKTGINSIIELNLKQYQFNFEYNPLFFDFINSNQKDVFAKTLKFTSLKKIGRENELSFNYIFDDIPTNVLNIYQQFYLTNFRTFTRNQLPFLQADKNQLGFRLKLQRTTKLLFSETNISKTFNDLNYIISNNFSTFQNTFEYIPYQNNRTVFSANTNVSKYLFKLKTNVKLSYNYNEIKQLQFNNSNLLVFKNEIHNLKFNLNPKFSSIIGFSSEYGINYNFNTNKSNSFKTRVVIQTSQNNVDINFSESLNLRISNEIIIYKNLNENANHFLDAFLNYKKYGSKFEYSLKCNNILNKKEYLTETNAEFFTNSNQFNLRLINILFSVNYKI